MRIRFYPLSPRAFPNLYGFGGSDPHVSVNGRPKRMKKYTDSNESALVWTGPIHVLYKTPELRFSRSVSKDDGEKVARWLHSHVKWLYSVIKSTVL